MEGPRQAEAGGARESTSRAWERALPSSGKTMPINPPTTIDQAFTGAQRTDARG